MRPLINKDTVMCMSLSARPSNFGTRFHNYLYDALGLDYFYKAFSTQDIVGAIAGVRALNIRGCAISMPFKEACIPLVDELAPSAKAIDSINTIVNTNGHLKAYNTDYSAIAHGTIVARNEQTGRQLAELYGFAWQADAAGLEADLLLNTTPIGMPGSPEEAELAFSEAHIAAARVVFDMVAAVSGTPLIHAAHAAGKTVIRGTEVFALQAVEQFVLYTGIRPDAELFAQAAAHARQQPVA